MSIQTRLEKLEQRTAQAAINSATMKPSEILARADELIQQGATPTADERACIVSLREMVTHAKP